MKLGRKAVKTDTRTVRLRRYLDMPSLPPPPESVDWSSGIEDWGVLLNDELGDCTIAGVAHACQSWSASRGLKVTVPVGEVLEKYERWCGYVAGDPASDQGGVELDVLTDWKRDGFQGNTLTGFAAVNPKFVLETRQAIQIFGGVYIGLALPLSAQEQVGAIWEQNWGADGIPGSWGGHCVWVTGYDPQGLTCVTWGKPQRMSWGFWQEYVDECWALLSPEWSEGAPNGINAAGLLADIAAIR